MMKNLIPFFLFLFALPASGAQIRGVVTNQSGEPLPFATIMIKGTTIGTMSNATGPMYWKCPAERRSSSANIWAIRRPKRALPTAAC